jgi:hypothetical protein
MSSHGWGRSSRFLGGRSFSSDKQPGAQRLPFAVLFPRASDSHPGYESSRPPFRLAFAFVLPVLSIRHPAPLDSRVRTEFHVTSCKQTIGVTSTRQCRKRSAAPLFERKAGERLPLRPRNSAYPAALASRTRPRLLRTAVRDLLRPECGITPIPAPPSRP